MQSTIQTLFLLLFSLSALAQDIRPALLGKDNFNPEVLRHDLALILKTAKLSPDLIQVHFSSATTYTVHISCLRDQIHLNVKAAPGERAATFYKGLRQLGFLFSHPRSQESPSLDRMKLSCGHTYTWRPASKIRGFHLHTLHPNEWVHGFFMGKTKVAEDYIRWLARNGQNALDVSLLRLPLEDISKTMKPLFELAQNLEIKTGVSLGIALHQQKSYKLLSLWQSLTGWQSEKQIESGMKNLFTKLPLNFMVLEAGTSEFTPTNYEKSLNWMNMASEIGTSFNATIFTKVHVSSNQHNNKYGNFNFLPQHASPALGIWPHTVMFYGLLDPEAPMYGNKNFDGIKKFMEQEKTKRPTWYYPETSYWVGMDNDIPLLLIDYLRTRSQDYKWIHEQGYEGHMNFTSGHALGGWLLDWNLCLMSDLDFKFNALSALKLLGEDAHTWKAHKTFQHTWFKEKGLIRFLSSANLQDELTSKHKIHERFTMKELSKNPQQLKIEIALLRDGLRAWPNSDRIHHPELKSMIRITWLRHVHALAIREYLQVRDEKFIKKAQSVREEAAQILTVLTKLPTNYPELPIFEKHANPTGYQFGYVYPAASLYFWEREERQVQKNSLWSYFPFNENLYNVFDILL